MRTTLDIADDVLAAVREVARREGRTAGEVLSTLARCGMSTRPTAAVPVAGPSAHYGFRPFPAGANLVTNEIIDDLRGRSAV